MVADNLDFFSELDNPISTSRELKILKQTRDQLEEELVAVEDELENYRAILADCSDPIVITDNKVEIVYVNPAWEKLAGYKFKEVKGKNPNIFKTTKTPKKVFQKMWQNLKKGQPFSTDEITNQRKDGQLYQIYSSFFPVKRDEKTIFMLWSNGILLNKKN